MPVCDQSYSSLWPYLEGIPGLCTRIDAIIAKQSESRSPVIILTTEQVGKLTRKARCLTSLLLSYIRLIEHDPLQDEVLAELLYKTKTYINEALYLLNLCTMPGLELHGDDGATNAVWASMCLTDHPHAVADQTTYEEVKLRRVCEEMVQLHADYCKVGGDSLKSTPSAIDMCLHFADKAKEMFLPRYVHTYESADKVPYSTDIKTSEVKGSFGVVRKVVDRKLHRTYAAKSFSGLVMDGDRRKVLREIGCLELCMHPNLIELVEAYTVQDDPETITIVTAPWAPYTLHQFLVDSNVQRRTQCPWFGLGDRATHACLLRVMKELASAVAYLHQRAIKHKDIKPTNILLADESTVRVRPIITDMGETKVFRLGMKTNPQSSSYEFLAPEQLLESGAAQSRLPADIWQLGCCFAMILTVAGGGRESMMKLWKSFQSTEYGASCNIAMEHERFMSTLADVCSGESAIIGLGYEITTSMLEKDPLKRPHIATIQDRLSRINIS